MAKSRVPSEFAGEAAFVSALIPHGKIRTIVPEGAEYTREAFAETLKGTPGEGAEFVLVRGLSLEAAEQLSWKSTMPWKPTRMYLLQLLGEPEKN